ncbi:secreted RxLR effector protein 161-like [Gossypium hirsutum]|uniref:Secreted RxLR effector protein 161-like n=1 Tax=Gossypium hirsutum TaxID=3635 RepID=A0ABM2Z0G6_GOSHI|nr:secreted RxLR effector protein 161-like [Gossypium hirsutum]
MSNCKTVSTPVAQGEKLTSNIIHERVDEKEYRSLVGFLLYLTATRPNIMYDVSLLSRFMHCCDVVHFKAAKRVLRYVKGTLNFGVKFEKGKKLKLTGYSDSDWVGSINDMKSTSGYFFTLGSGVFCCSSEKQQIVAQLTAEAEYIAANAAVNQTIWLRKLLCDLNEYIQATEIRVNNQSAVAIAKILVFHGKTKHLKIKFHFVREAEQLKKVNLVHCSSENQFADILTKSLVATRLDILRRNIGVCCIQSKEEC